MIKTIDTTDRGRRWLRSQHACLLLLVWACVFLLPLFGMPLLDDADATHASAALHVLQSHDLVTLHVDGVRYLEKAPLPYWVVAASFAVFGVNAFAAHLPQAVCVLLLAMLCYAWTRSAWDERTALYAAMALLTSVGPFLFTRVFIPEALLSLLLAGAMYAAQRGLEQKRSPWMHAAYAMLALAVLTKGLIAIVFAVATLALYLVLTAQWRRWRELRIVTGTLLFAAIAAPWHILAGLRNTGGYRGHGFFWFYFINEHVMRFLGRRIPHDYNKLPGNLYWVLHAVWLFPWSLFLPAAVAAAWTQRSSLQQLRTTVQGRTVLLLCSLATVILLFFAVSTNQEYYTFPAYLPLLILAAVGVRHAERQPRVRAWVTAGFGALVAIGLAIAGALFVGLWSARRLPFEPDIGDVIAHRGVGNYTLSMSHFFDLTDASFAALRLPATLAVIAFTAGPVIAFLLWRRGKDAAATISVALTSAVFLCAAGVALRRFSPMLSSRTLAVDFMQAEKEGRLERGTELMIYGDQAYGSTLPFYAHRIVPLVEGRTTSMWFGSTFPDAPPIFLSGDDLMRQWGQGPRKVLFVPEERRSDAEALLRGHGVLLWEESGKKMWTDRPLQGDTR